MKPLSLKSLALVAALVGAAACGEERAPINQVQPNVLDKTFFVGKDLEDPRDNPEFYAQATLVDVGTGANTALSTSSWAQKLTRIRWDIQEDVLLARLAYERVENTDGRGAGKADLNGMIVGAWPITKHFDIQRQYNPSTGEQLNVIVENTTDRPWQQRKYMRVDWSKNLNVGAYDFDTLSYLGLVGVRFEPLAYTVNDPTHRDAPRFDLEEGYFDITNKAVASPEEVHFRWGSIPACFLPAWWGGGKGAWSCSSTEITVRHSFKRVVDNDYVPVDWDGVRFSVAGAFYTERKGYVRNYGMTDDQWHRFANLYNIWERSHYYEDPVAMTGAIECYTPATTPAGQDPNRDVEPADGTADECQAAGSGSQCDTFGQKCTLPFRQRVAKPIALFYTEESDLNYWDGTEWATHDWDVAMRSAVMTARYAECMRVGEPDCAEKYPVLTGQQVEQDDAIWLAREVDACRLGRSWQGEDCHALAERLGNERGFSRAVIATAQMEEMVVLCHSPVEVDDPPACGGPRLPADLSMALCQEARANGDRALVARCDEARSARLGDLRFHQVTAIKTPEAGAPWGIMVDADDPLTGEKVAASINVWTAGNDNLAQHIIDTARFIKGELSAADVTEGTYIADFAAAAVAASRSGSLPKLSASQRNALIADFARVSPERLEQLEQSSFFDSPWLQHEMERITFDLSQVRAEAFAPTTSQPIYEARREMVVGTPIEAALMTPAMQQLAGGGIGLEEATELVSPMRGGNPLLIREMRHTRELALAQRGACILEQSSIAPTGVPVLADILEAKFGPFNPDDDKGTQLARAERMRRYVSQRLHHAVLAHEMGHSFGLRHNFVSSSDAFGFRPQYWQLRTDNGTITRACTDLDPTGSCVGPRYFDPVTDNEYDNLLPMFMHSSVMDYAGELTQDFMGLGAYDFHAVRFFYGDALAVHADDSFKVRTPRGTAMLMKMDSFGGTVGFRPVIGGSTDPLATTNIHYSQMQKEYGLISDCTEVDPALFRPSTWDEERLGAWHPTLDGLIVSVGGTYSRCKQQPVDFVHWSELRRPRTVGQVGAAEADVRFTSAGPAIDKKGRTRVPYGFASDNWADLGNLAVYRHDNGADPYELFDFLITQQEVNHIFDNYRRKRSNFSVRGAAARTLTRYNEKLRDGAKGLALSANINKDWAMANGVEPETWWAVVSRRVFGDNILAAGIAFDHFARQLARPEPGPHYFERPAGSVLIRPDTILRSAQDPVGDAGATRVVIPNGATGRFGNVSYGGKPIENAYAPDEQVGDFRTEYVINSGSYYDKAYTAYLMTESYDNFVSDSRSDFTDARYRAVSLADMFPDGYRRWLANNLTGDDFIKGPRVASNGTAPILDEDGYPKYGIGWTSWRGFEGPTACFSQSDTLLCDEDLEVDTMVLDPQVGWEQQKFLIAWTLWFLPENAKQGWLNQLGIWELGADSDPGFANRIEFHDPSGKIYVAKTFGREEVFGKLVQKGIAARVLEYANELVNKAYVTTPIDVDEDGIVDWYEPVLGPHGQPEVKWDPALAHVTPEGSSSPTGSEGCNETENWACTCSMNRACVELSRYSEVPFFLREALRAYGHGSPWMK